MRLEGRTGKAQGYTKLTYHLDVKVTDKPQVGEFDLTQEELDKVCSSSSLCREILSYLISRC